MKVNVLIRQVHNWGSIIIALPLVVMIGAGLVLMLKKDIDWIQPPSQRGVVADAPIISFAQMLDAAKAFPEVQIAGWEDVDRIDVQPGRGLAKLQLHNRWEIQIDTTTGEILQTAVRRSDVIEQIHDGTFFADWVKYLLFLPAGIVLLVLWLSGVWMFFLPYYVRRARQKRGASQSSGRQPASGV